MKVKVQSTVKPNTDTAAQASLNTKRSKKVTNAQSAANGGAAQAVTTSVDMSSIEASIPQADASPKTSDQNIRSGAERQLVVPSSGGLRSYFQSFTNGANALGVMQGLTNIASTLSPFLLGTIANTFAPSNSVIYKQNFATTDIKPNPNYTPTATEFSVSEFHLEQSQMCRIIGEMIVSPETGPYIGRDSQNIKACLKIVKRYNAMPKPRDELDLEPLNAAFCELMRTTSSLSFDRKLRVLEKVEGAILQSTGLRTLATSPVAHYGLALIYLRNPDGDLKNAALKLLRANHGVISRTEEFKSRPGAELAPWWDKSLCKSPDPEAEDFVRDRPTKQGKRVGMDPSMFGSPGMEALPNTLDMGAAVAHLQFERIRFLTAHPEILAVGQELSQWIEKDPSMAQKVELSPLSLEIHNLLLPHQSLNRLAALGDTLSQLRQAGQARPEIEDIHATLTQYFEACAQQSDVQPDVAAQLTFHVRNIRSSSQANHALELNIRKANSALSNHQAISAEERSNANAASLILELESESKNAQPTTRKKASGTRARPLAASKNTAKKDKDAAKPAARPPSFVAPKDLYPSKINAVISPEEESEFSVVLPRKSKEAAPWALEVSKFVERHGVRTPQELHQFFQQVVSQSKQLEVPQKRLVAGVFLYTRAEPRLLADLLPIFVDPGSFSRLSRGGNTEAECVAASLEYHFDKHVTGKTAMWARGGQTTVEDLIEMGLKLSAEQPRALKRTRVDNATSVTLKKTNDEFFGIYSESNLILSCGPRDRDS